MSAKTGKTTGRSAIADVVAREYTIHLHKRVCRLVLPEERSWRTLETEKNDGEGASEETTRTTIG